MATTAASIPKPPRVLGTWQADQNDPNRERLVDPRGKLLAEVYRLRTSRRWVCMKRIEDRIIPIIEDTKDEAKRRAEGV